MGCLRKKGTAYRIVDLTKFQAGIVIAQEAGGFVSGSASSTHDGEVSEVILTGRKYIVVRYGGSPLVSFLNSIDISAIEGAEGKKQQVALVTEFYNTVTEWDAI